VRIAWLSFLDVNSFSGGGEVAQRDLIRIGRERGHAISESPFLRGRAQRVLRRSRAYRRLEVDWNADVFVLSNIRNCPQLDLPFPADVLERVLTSQRVALVEDAWVDTCEFDMPCGGDPQTCPNECDREWSNDLFARSQIAVFVSPMQQSMIKSVLEVALPRHQILRRPFINTQRFKDLGLERDIDVLYVGTISEPKGYRNLTRLYDADRLTLVGPSVLDEPVTGTYLGALSYEALPELYNRARTFAHLPEWYEPMGRTIVEASLCGCNVITNERVGVTTFPKPDWTDPAVIEGNGERFWIDFEGAVEKLPER
jgi:glycosyltransferase involved in cell wall biosynthesis